MKLEDNKTINQIEIIATGDTNVIIEYKSQTTQKCLHNGIIRTIADENAKLNVTIVNLLNEESDNFEAIENKLEKNSKVNYTKFRVLHIILKEKKI